MRIVKEDLTGCINWTASGAPATRCWVIEEPINETGICKEFKTEEEAQKYIREHAKQKQCVCCFYEKDTKAEEEAKEMDAAIIATMGEENWRAMCEMAELQPEDNSPLAKCGEFCRYLHSGKGYPGEYVYHCTAPGNEHIIHVDFIELEII
jgi:hypothetical protein